ncbi:DET1 homolog [Perognathus longimembris pacificus]|uniref:DET1 homolog n=1 Tax=Perognathus longimembris pacificus TaxID=214514 RepID=UPI00201A19CC|nr:DET1 homolog [Perognathus longimembris pacificus]
MAAMETDLWKGLSHQTEPKEDTILKSGIALFKPQRIKNQNIVHRLERRRISSGKAGTHWHQVRVFYQNVFPNFTVVDVDEPPCFLHKFSPDGLYFLAFSSDLTSLQIYKYRGCQAAGTLLQGFEGEFLPRGRKQPALSIQRWFFECFFVLLHIKKLTILGEHLDLDCSIFTNDSKYVIVGSSSYVQYEHHRPFCEIFWNHESLASHPLFPIENYSLYIIDLRTGRLCDKRIFLCDKVILTNNQGLYLYKNTLAILSLLHQNIHIFQVTPDGTFIDLRTIGRFCYEDDLLTVSAVFPETHQSRHANLISLYRDTFIDCLKHRMLVYLWRQTERCGNSIAKRSFFRYFDQMLKLHMCQLQLLDENHLLIKYTENFLELDVIDASQASVFVVYNMVSTEVMAVFENSSDELLELFGNYNLFQDATPHSDIQFPCSPSSNNYARQIIQQQFKDTIINDKYGEHGESGHWLLDHFPFCCSPYLDMTLFSYDSNCVSVMEQPKAYEDRPIRFYAQDSGLLKFQMQTGLVGRPTNRKVKRLVSFIFHPSEPFAISVQKSNAEYIVNFHVRHNST